MANQEDQCIKVWDVPTRIFHWAMVLVFAGLILTGEFIEDWTEIHFYLGYTLSGLIIFRIIWGFLGSYHARFRTFIYSPKETLGYVKSHSTGKPKHYYGHNPMGALMVFAIIGGLTLQLATGPSLSDEVLYDAPFYALMPEEITDLAGRVHDTMPNILLAFVSLHVLAVIAHKVVLKDNLVPAMFHGKKLQHKGLSAPQVKVSVWALVLSVGVAGGWVFYLFSVPI